jgi:hypothetical protein
MRILMVLLVVMLFTVRTAHSNFTVFVGDGSPYVFNASAGTGTLPVFAYNADTDDPINLSSYSLVFDIAAGNANFSTFSGNFLGGIFPGGSSFVNNSPVGSFAAASSAVSGTVTLPTTQATALKLFDLTFSIAPTTPSGTYSFSFLPNATFFGSPVNTLSGDGSGLLNPFGVYFGTNFNEFKIEGNPVPEPTSLLLVACAGGVAAYKLRRRRRLQARVAHSPPMIVG